MKLREKTNIEITEENGINYTMLTNVVEEKNTKARIRATLQIISKILCGTLGPYGTTTIIQDREMRHFATKDGYDLMNRITFDNEVSRTILDLVRQVASNQVLIVGDGSTSAIVVASALYSSLTDPELNLFEKTSPKDVLDILNYLAEILENELKTIAKPISFDLNCLETVAMIATNNDSDAGKLIRNVYEKIGEFGFISTDVLQKKDKDEYEIKQGIEWSRGYIDEYFARAFTNKKILHDKEPRVFLTNSVLTYEDLATVVAPLLGDICGRQKAELVIVANDYDEDVRTFFKQNRLKHLGGGKGTAEIVFSVVDIEQVTDTGKATLEDIAVLTGCEIYDKFKVTQVDFVKSPERFIGKAEKILITATTTQIIGKELDADKEKIKLEAIKAHQDKLNELSKIEEPNKEQEFDTYLLRRRISSLTDSTAIIHVAGKSLTERMTRERLFEDAILACKSAIENGIIPGGNIMIPRILRKKKDILPKLLKKYNYIPAENLQEFFNDFIKLLENAFLESYRNVLNNSYFNEEQVNSVIEKCLKKNKFYNLKTHSYDDIDSTNVVNSVDTDIQILRSVISIIGILATSNQMITLNFNVSDQIKK